MICVFLISRWIFQNRKLTMLDKDIKDSTKIVEKIEEDKRNDADEELNNPIISSERSSFNLSNASFMSADLDELKEKNSDTVGWIKVLGTKIDYPFVQTTDNDYYLSHNFNKRFTNLGWVFGDYRNKWINFNRNTIIYAHNLNTGQFFGTLLDTLKESWFNNYDNHYVKLSTFDSDTIWQVVSVYTIKPESYYIRSIFSDYDFNEFLHTIKERSVFDFNYNYTLYDKILTLSTCDNGGKRRMVLHAKLVGILYK
ncbi:MAG: class B sortase [Bacilli bacterium]